MRYVSSDFHLLLFVIRFFSLHLFFHLLRLGLDGNTPTHDTEFSTTPTVIVRTKYNSTVGHHYLSSAKTLALPLFTQPGLNGTGG